MTLGVIFFCAVSRQVPFYCFIFYSKDMNKKKLTLTIIFSVIGGLALFFAIPTGIFIFSMMRIDPSVKNYRSSYSFNEIKLAESNTFKKLNDVTYPKEFDPHSFYSDEEIVSYAQFSNSVYRSIMEKERSQNMAYSAVNLYSTMNHLYGAISDESLANKFDSLLGLDDISRQSFYNKIMRNNSFAKDECTTHIKNAAFFSNQYQYSNEYVDHLTKYYAEAYQLDFRKDQQKILSWVDQALHSKNFVDERYLGIDGDTALMLMSALYFKNAWHSKYLSENNVRDYFYLSDGNKVETTFMKHTYIADGYYDYGKYVAVTDYFAIKTASITYFVPKDIEDNIFELTNDKNIFINEKDKFIPFPDKNHMEESGSWVNLKVNLTTPKFELKTDMDFEKPLKSLGLQNMFDRSQDSFGNAFTNMIKSTYMQGIKQRNEVEFNEDGATIKALVSATIGAGSAGPVEYDTLDVNLNQPFIYVIRDHHGLPIFVGHVDNPTSNN